MILSVVQIVLLIIIAFLLFRRQRTPLRLFYWPAFIVKSIAGVCLGLLYMHYYNGEDTLMYFSDANALSNFASRDPWAFVRFLWSGDVAPNGVTLVGTQPRALFFTKFACIVSLLTGGNYWVISLWFSFISFLSAWYLTSFLHKHFKMTVAPVIAFLFFPSVVFWTSGLEKEGLAMAMMYFITVIFLKLYTKTTLRYWEWLFLPFAFWILWSIKYYFLAVFLPVASTLLVMRLLVMKYWQIKSKAMYAVIWISIFLVPLYIASIVHPNFYPERFLDVIISNHDAFVALSEDHDIIHYDRLSSSAGDIIRNMPLALTSGIFRPFLWESVNPIQIIAAIENLFIAVLTLWSITNLLYPKGRSGMTITPLVAGTLIFVGLLAVFLSLSTPNFGTLSRYRVGFLPYYVLVTILPISAARKFDRL